MADRSRGRGRGSRGRSIAQQQQYEMTKPGPVQQVGPQEPRGGRGAIQPEKQPEPVVAWGRAAAQEPQTPPAIGRGEQLAAQLAKVHISATRDSSYPSTDVAVGRGGKRGGCNDVDIATLLNTKPSNTVTKCGITGTPVTLQTNYFQLVKRPDWCIFQYRVDVAPEEDRTFVRKALLGQHQSTLGSYIFDGTVLYTIQRLPENLSLTSERRDDSVKIIISIKFVGELMYGDHHYLTVFNIIMRKCLEHMDLQLVGRNYFDAKAKVVIQDYKLELWPGYVTSIRQHENAILMCSEISNKVMRQETVLEVMNKIRSNCRGDWQKECDAQLIGLIVLTGYNNNTYRISQIDWNVTPMSKFKLRGNEETTYYDYYKHKYNIAITNPRQPLLASLSKVRDRRAGQDEVVFLVPELCRTTGLTDEMRSNFNLMKALSVYTRVEPKGRIEKLMRFNKRIQSEPKIVEEFRKFDLKLDTKLVEVTGRELPREPIFFDQSKQQFKGPNPADWTSAFRSMALWYTVPLKDWVCILPRRMESEFREFKGHFQQCCQGMRFSVNKPQEYYMDDDRAASYTQAIENIMSKCNPQMLFCAVPNNRADRYSAIKKKCTVDRPVLTQVVIAKNLTKGKSVATKIAVQMSCKMGGVAWVCDVPMKGVMICGFDVCHDTNSKNKDFGAMVASLDKTCTRYFSAVSAHTNGEELSNDLGLMMVKALHKYKEVNNALPSKIVMYRDGVGEGQLPYVFDHEVVNLQKKVEEVYADFNLEPKLAFIIVTKRINTRIFKREMNPAPGTVVDDIITNPARFDFFIVSQHVTQGTVSPTAYNVLHNTTGLNADKLQRLTYKLCHMYFNWAGTIRVPAPCQYAHKLAFLVSQSIHQPPSQHLDSLLHFL